MPRRVILALPLLLLGLAAAAPAGAQRRAPRSLLLVHVVDEQGKPVAGAYVTVAGVEHGETTNREGQARLSAIPRGNRLVEVRRQGYAYRRVGTDFAGGDTVRAEVALAAAPIEIEGIVATTWGRNMRLVRNGFYDREKRGIGAFMTRQRLDQVRPFHTADAFRYMRGFMVRPSGGRDVVVATRGMNGCVPNVYIDGGTMFVRGPGDQATALDMVAPDDIEAIEAYQGAASIPVEYNVTGTTCGVILIWTRH